MSSGVKVDKNQSSFDELKKKIPHWIHHTRIDETNVNGMIYLPKCDCSECGYTVNFEKPVCPRCHVKMTKFAPTR